MSADEAPTQRRGTTSRRRASLLIAVLCLLLGFALAVQVRTTSSSGLEAARQEDLVRILDDLSARQDRLREDIAGQEAVRERLTTGGDQAAAALDEARLRQEQLGILAGTLAAQGPGIELRVSDPDGAVGPEVILDAIQELRAAGAEAMQIGPSPTGAVRIGVSTSFTGVAGELVVDGQDVAAPYLILAIGEPATLQTALNIPGGVVNTVNRAGGEATIEQRDLIQIDALRALPDPEYAQPAVPTD